MPTTLVLTFPWGRYHATPWGRHVNEGEVELPPSPWRLLRALYSVWQTRAPELSDEVVHGLLSRLAEPPTYYVPRHGVSHTRHYYPDTAHRSGAGSTDRTLDAFAVFERDADLAVVWPFDLPGDQQAALARIASSIPYLGRADSLCTGSLPREWVPGPHDEWTPVDAAETVPSDVDVTAVLAPELPLTVAAMLARPVDVRRDGLLFPAGTRFVGYQRSRSAPPLQRRTPRPARTVTAVRFSVLQTGLPPETDSLVYTDLLRQTALHFLPGERSERRRTMLGGRTADDQALSGHQHAHYLPVLAERRLSGLVVWVPGGLPTDEVKALTAVRRLFSPANDAWRLTVRVAGMGPGGAVLGEFGGRSAVWRSVTPFTPSRYPKRNAGWMSFMHGEVARELAHRGLPEPARVSVVDGDPAAWRRYRPSARLRRDARQGNANRASAFLRVEFTSPVRGPLSLGHLSHFGLGLFAPEQG